MISFISAVGFRYFSIGLQFVIIVLITRHLSSAESGTYLLIFGVVTSTYYLAGLGLPDGLVKSISLARASGDLGAIRLLVGRSSAIAALSSAFLIAIGMVTGHLLGIPAAQTGATGVWWLSYGIVFFCAQCLLATGQVSQGSFFFYPATNIFQISFLALLVLWRPSIGLSEIITTSIASAVCCAVTAMVFLLQAVRRFPSTPAAVPLWPVFSLGFTICASRVLQSALYWIPVWMTGLLQGPTPASLVGVASRLAVAVASIMAAVRFTVRPAIVAAAARGDWQEIERTSRKIASVATLAAVAALIGSIVAGQPIVALVFGEAYRPAALVLSVLLLGTIGECFGGPVDEVLRMTDRSQIVLGLLAAMSILEVMLIAALGASPISSAAAQSIVFVGMYGFLIAYVRSRDGVLIVPYPSFRAFFGRET